MSIHLLAIGNNYPGTSSELAGCVNDAKDIAAKFARYCESSKVLLNSKADRAGIFKEGRKFLDRLKKGDLGILSISGHGTRERGTKGFNEAVVCADFEVIWDTEMGALLGDREKGSVLAVLADTCHAGGLPRGTTRNFAEVIKRRTGLKKPRSIPIGRCKKHKDTGGTKLRALPDIIPYLACLTEQYAWDAKFDGRGNGAATYYTLRSTDLKPTESFGKIFTKLCKQLPNADYDQQPVCIASARNLRRTLGEFRKA